MMHLQLFIKTLEITKIISSLLAAKITATHLGVHALQDSSVDVGSD